VDRDDVESSLLGERDCDVRRRQRRRSAVVGQLLMAAGTTSPLLLLTSPLGDDTQPFQEGTLHAIALSAVEQLSAPFDIDLTVVSTERVIDPNELLYQPLCVTVRRVNGIDRFFDGVVRRVDAVGFAQRARFEYRLRVVPRMWFMAQTMDCRIFQQKTVVEILQTLFAEHDVTRVDYRIFGARPVREYTTQYNETDLDFVHRLMQESGYFYFFEHSPSGHTLVVTDANQAFKPMQQPVHWVMHNGNNVDIFDRWAEALETAYGAVQLQDYDPTRPSTPVFGQQTTTFAAAGAARRDVFRWPAMTIDNQIAGDRARFRMEASEAKAALRHGHGFDPNLCPGFRFSIARDPSTGAENVLHAVHGARHTASDETWIGGTTPPEYECGFTCFQQSVSWRDDLSLPRPTMNGIFSAIVLGEPGEEIHADSLARIKVRPLFDHRKETVASMAIWIRILHAWAGDRWGWQHLPRVGTEVGISFMSGDPDNPVVVGCFYNQEMSPVFPVPSQQTKQGFRSRSTLRGSTQEYNELSFDDKKGQELVLLHAQKDHRIEVEHDQNATIGNDRSVETQNNDSLTSKLGDITITADAGSVSIRATTSITLSVGTSTIVLTSEAITIDSAGAVPISAAAAIPISAAGEVSIEAGGDVNILGTAVSIEALDGEVDCLPFPV
jgi:type VI secretion system secreted protein VgrG